MSVPGQDSGRLVPLEFVSRELMLPFVPAAMRMVEKHSAEDLIEMIFGKDDDGGLAEKRQP